MNDKQPGSRERRCAAPGSCPTCREIVRQFEMHPRTLSEVAARIQKSVSTVSFHVSSLVVVGVIRKADGKYILSSPEHVDDLVLQVIAEKAKTLDEVVSDRRLSVYPVEQVHQSIDRHLLRRHLVSWPKIQERSTRFEDEYKLSYVGAEALHVCLRCGKPLDDGPVVQFHVAEVISERYGAQSLGREEYHHGVLLHPACFAQELAADYMEQEKLRSDNLCGLCGLPIDPSALEADFSSPKLIGVRSLVPHLREDELLGIVSYVTGGKAPKKPSLGDIEHAVQDLIAKEKFGIRGIADCEKLLRLADEGLRRGRHRTYEKIDLSKRARALWDVAYSLMKSDEERVKRLVNEICGPQNVLLGRTTLYLQIYPFMEKGEFTEEEVYYTGGPENSA